MRSRIVAGAVLGVVMVRAPAAAEVTDRTPNGFTITVTAAIAAPPDTVWDSLVRHVGDWWDKEHTYSGDATRLSIDAKPGGCFCESLPGGGGVEHGAVVNVQPGRLLRMRGALGPLQEGGIAGSLTWQIERAGEGATLTFTHVAGGYYAGGLDKLADIVDTVLAHQVALLKAYAEKAAAR